MSFRHPATGKVTSATVGRAVVMTELETVNLDKDYEASHLCHNKTCILKSHICFEPHSENMRRKVCVNEGACLGHGVFPDCLLYLLVVFLLFFFLLTTYVLQGVSC